MSSKKSRLIKSLYDLQKVMGSSSTRKSVYILRNDREDEYAIVVAYGADKAFDILRDACDEDWRYFLGKGVTVTCAQHGVDDEPQLIWFGYFGKRNGECSRVQSNTPTEHQKHKTAPDAQQKEPDDTKSP